MFNIREFLNMNNKDKGQQGQPMAMGRSGTPIPAKAMIRDGEPGGYAATRPVPGQAQVPYSQETADRYNANPMSPEFSGKNAIDPKYFGYPADTTTTRPGFNPTPFLQHGTSGPLPYRQYEDGSDSNGRRAMDSPDDYMSQTLRRLLGY